MMEASYWVPVAAVVVGIGAAEAAGTPLVAGIADTADLE